MEGGEKMRKTIEDSVAIMANRIAEVLSTKKPAIYLFGSMILDDFRLGWSDIDILCLTEQPIAQQEAQVLVPLRQTLLDEHPDNPYFRLFEGGMLSWQGLLTARGEQAVYWGTSGQRTTDAYQLDPFSTIEVIDFGRLLCGADHRDRLARPTREELIQAVAHHYATIRAHATQTSAKVTSCGWLLDIARCLYTLETGEIIAKTKAGEWALEQKLTPEPEVLNRAVEIRKAPARYVQDAQTLAWLASLGPHIQLFADILEDNLSKRYY